MFKYCDRVLGSDSDPYSQASLLYARFEDLPVLLLKMQVFGVFYAVSIGKYIFNGVSKDSGSLNFRVKHSLKRLFYMKKPRSFKKSVKIYQSTRRRIL
jgi:hypothetical protein